MPDTKNPVLLYAFPDLELPIVDANGDIQQGIYTTVFSDRSAFPDLAGFAKPFVQVMLEGTTTKTHFYLQRLSLGATATGTGSQAAYWMLLSGIQQRSPEPSNNEEGKGKDQKDKGKGKSNTSKNKDTFSILLPLTQSTGLSRPDPLLPLATALQSGTSVADQTRVPITLSSFTPLSLHTGTYDSDNAMLTLPAQGLTQQTIALLSTVFTSVSDPNDVMRMPRTSVYEIAKEKKKGNEGFVQQEGFREGNTKKACTINDATTNDKPFNYSLENASFDAGNLMLVLGLLAVVMFFVSDGLLNFLASMFSAAGITNTGTHNNRPLHFAHATLLLCLLFVIGSLMAFRQYSNMMIFIVIFMVYYNKVSVLFLGKEINDQRNSIITMFFEGNFFAHWWDVKALPLYLHWISAIISLSLLGVFYKKDSEKKDKDKGTDDAYNFADPLFISGLIFYIISTLALIFSIVWAVSS